MGYGLYGVSDDLPLGFRRFGRKMPNLSRLGFLNEQWLVPNGLVIRHFLSSENVVQCCSKTVYCLHRVSLSDTHEGTLAELRKIFDEALSSVHACFEQVLVDFGDGIAVSQCDDEILVALTAKSWNRGRRQVSETFNRVVGFDQYRFEKL